ncbi:MAG: ComEA protein [Candidatus Beckwithbacteria bacterium GW2011_GWA2_43_10]|uniref:ComEA protein n=1 Tax=Candidatus Beckwithbacteria bacterium GW2011_GWA2_43_10 TaxID=1618369 RepID=A0A0G1C3R6_9BACT|nr:MAG: ComEA protein [Candidatus Beckwithbacteria bacterium GW2011_GWA2_43_10]
MMMGVLSVVVVSSRTEGEELVIQKAGESEELEDKLMADVGGAVMKPGVYELKGGARVNQALIAAGGLREEADREWVEKNLNLAAKVTDGQKIYIPSNKETIKDVPSLSKGTSLSEKININTASITELDTLYGVGPATAQKIIDSRPYGSVEELVTKKVVSNKVYEAIKNQITVF